jgi:hypothetical protein
MCHVMLRRSLVVLVSLTACGEHGSTPPPPDIVEPPPPVRGPVALTILHDGEPAVGVPVVFHDALGLVASVLTDASGLARVEMQGGGFVTAVNPFGTPADGIDDLRTYAAVQVGDLLVLESDSRASTITVPVTAPVDPGAARYQLHTTCGSGSLAVQNGVARGNLVLTNCNNVADVLLETFDANDAPLRSIFRPGLAVVDGDPLVLPNGYEPIPNIEVTFSGFDGKTIAARTALASPLGQLRETSFDVTIGSGVGTKQLALPNILDGRIVTESRPNTDELALGTHRLLDWGPANFNQFINLFDVRLLDITSSPEFFPPRSVFWGESAFVATQLESAPPPDDRSADFTIVTLAITRETKTWRWTLATRHDGPSATLPLLPIELGDLNVAPGDTVEITQLMMAKVPGGYDAVRARIHNSQRLEDFIVDPSFGRIIAQDLRR